MEYCIGIAQVVKIKQETTVPPESVRNRFSSILKWTIKSKQNVCIVGPAGTGKSELLRRIHQSAKEKNAKIAVTTLTGQAAEELRQKMSIDNAQTIHKWCGTTIDEILSTDILIIDDFSMINDKFFGSIDAMCKRKRNNYQKPFGGMQLIVAGDPYLLPPIEGRPCFKSDVWDNCNFRIYKLTYPLRFGDTKAGTRNRKWFDMLKRVRKGHATPADLDIIYQKWGYNQNIEDLSSGYLRNQLELYRQHKVSNFPKVLFGHKSRVRSFNLGQLDNLNSRAIILKAEDNIVSCGSCSVEDVKKKLSADSESVITVKVGAPIVVTRNIDGILSGTSGIFVHKKGDNILIDVKKKTCVETLKIGKHLFEIKFMKNGEKTYAQRLQYPISLAYSTTVHKAQGSESKKTVTVVDDLWANGHFYTALSRGKSPDDVILASGKGKLKLSKINKYNRWGDQFNSREN